MQKGLLKNLAAKSQHLTKNSVTVPIDLFSSDNTIMIKTVALAAQYIWLTNGKKKDFHYFWGLTSLYDGVHFVIAKWY